MTDKIEARGVMSRMEILACLSEIARDQPGRHTVPDRIAAMEALWDKVGVLHAENVLRTENTIADVKWFDADRPTSDPIIDRNTGRALWLDRKAARMHGEKS